MLPSFFESVFYYGKLRQILSFAAEYVATEDCGIMAAKSFKEKTSI